MNRVLGKGFAVVAVGVLATAFTPACAENDQSIFINSALFPSQNRQNGCVYTDDPTQTALFQGKVDAAIRDNYTSVLLVGSQLISRGDDANARAESNRVHLNGVVVRVTDPNGGLIGEFTSLGTGFINPQLNNVPSFSSMQVVTIDAPTLAKIAAGLERGRTKLVVANIKVFGKTVGGVDLESSEFQFPIEVCNGCLVSFATGDDPAVAGLDCSLPIDANAGQAAVPCEIGQDETTPCQLCQDRPICRTP